MSRFDSEGLQAGLEAREKYREAYNDPHTQAPEIAARASSADITTGLTDIVQLDPGDRVVHRLTSDDIVHVPLLQTDAAHGDYHAVAGVLYPSIEAPILKSARL
jgi:hypothetical protein